MEVVARSLVAALKDYAASPAGLRLSAFPGANRSFRPQ